MDYFFQEQRWTDTFLSLHVKKFKRIILFLLIAFSAAGTKAQSDVKFNDGVRYSQWVIDSRMNDFYANTTKCGFAVYDQSGNKTADRVDGKTSLDYVVGLVAKSIIEASQYYSQFTWAQSFAKPWFLSIQNYGNKFYSGVATSGGSLDDLNAVKLYLPLRELTKSEGTFEDNTTYSNTATALNKAITGLKAHNSSYSIKSGTLAETAGNTVTGGWWHKKDYQNQMWLDGAYMGPALFAELVNYSGKTTNIDSSNDWDLIVKQFTILRNMCWNENDKLPYHAFAADGGTNSTSHSDTWAGLSSKSPYCFHSASYWGRAVGWYFLALVDILEQMDKANLSSSTGYTTLKGYLAETAAGIKARQDQTTGGWYQILDENSDYSASSYNGKSYTKTYNYIESSATALFTAAYLKAIRLGYLAENDYKTVAENGYKCLVNNFFSVDANGKVNIFGSCRSAGLGGSGDNYKAGKEKFRDGSKPYYLLGYDVARVDKSEKITEGKVLGAFIMAATEYERLYQPSTLLSKDLNSTYTLSSNESLSVEVLGDGTPTYQWYDANTENPIEGATDASYTPTKSGKYYCKITVTPPSTSAKTRTASGSYTITTRTADVTVSGTSTGDTGDAGNAGETVLFYTDFTESGWNGVETTNSTKTTTATINGTQVTLNGFKDNGFSVSNGTMTFPGSNMSDNNNYYIAIPVSGVNGSITIEFGGTDNYKYYYDICSSGGTLNRTETNKVSNGFVSVTESYSGTDAIIYIGRSSSYYKTISSIKITTPSSSESDSRATFTYNEAEITFSEKTAGDQSVYTTTLEIGASKAGQPITITPTKQEGATIKQNNEIVNGDIKITAPSTIGQTTTSTYTVTSKDGTSTTKYEINVKLVKENVVLVYAQSGGKTEWTWDTTANPDNTGYTNPTLKVYLANADGTPSKTEVKNVTGIQYMSDVLDVATVDDKGNITIKNDANGGAKIYAILKGNEYYNDAQTFFNIVVKQGYSYSVATDTEIKNGPDLNQSVYIKNGETKLVKMTFGGWKWNTFKDEKDNNKLKSTYVVNEKTRTDEWKNPITSDESVIASIDGYKTYISGATDAVDESKKKSDVAIYGSTRYGWFKPAEIRKSDGYLETYPYSLPVRGAYMTFEPTQNGKLTVYILQNGAWNTNGSGNYQGIDYKEGDIIPGEFRPHSFYICNQRGLNVHQFSPKTFNCTTKQKVKGSYYCDLENHKDDPYNIATWTEFSKYMSKGEQDSVAANWKSGINGAQKIVRLDNGSYLAIEKGIVKYTFFVTANETYYLFSNFSKLGFCGANFVPSETVKPTNDVDHNITLSDVSAYPTPKKVTDDTDADKNKYAWKFGNDIKGYVKGFTIPLFNSITLNRTFKPNQWTTLSLPFNLTQTEVEQIFGKGTQIIVFDKANPTSARIYLTFFYHEIQNVLPGYPYLIRPTLVDADGKQMVTKSNSADYAPTYTINTEGKLTQFTVYNKAINPAIKQHEFVYGDYTAKCTPSYCTANVSGNNQSNYSMHYENGDIFVSEGNGTVYISEGQSYGKGYRSYIEYTGTTPPSAKALSISFSGVEDGDDNGTTTEIRVTELADDVIQTLGIGGVYNLNGQKVADTTRNLPAGIYIVNGRKFVVK